jgi:DNA-binding NarL/FixJ family response regulator
VEPKGLRRYVRVAIADDHPLFREGLRKAISTDPAMFLVGEAADGQEALALCAREAPRVLLLDIAMPRCNGYGVLEQLFRVSPETRALIITAYAERSFEEKALAAGAAGFVQKDASVTTILKAIRSVADGELWATRAGTSRVLRRRDSKGEDRLFGALTSREREILALLGHGLRSRQIALRTGLSERTVSVHVANLTQKLGVRSRVEAALLARQYADLAVEESGEGDEVEE